MSATTTRLAEYSLIHKGKRFGGFYECLEQEENRTLAEDLSISSDLSLITVRNVYKIPLFSPNFSYLS